MQIKNLLIIVISIHCLVVINKANINNYKNYYNTHINNLQLTLFDIYISKYTTTDNYLAYINTINNKTYLNLQEIFYLLNFNLLLNNNTLNGLFFNKPVIINLNKNQIILQGKTFTISQEDIFITPDNIIYVSTQFLQTYFEIDIKLDYSKLIIYITSSNLFLVDITNNNYKKRQQSSVNNLKTTYISNDKLFNTNRPYFYFNTLNLQYTNNFYNNKKSYNNNSFSLSTGGVFANLDTYTSLNYKNNNQTTSYNGYINFSKPLVNNFTGIEYFSFGDINSLQINGVTSSKLQSGLYISSNNDYGINTDKTITISGPLDVGYEVELYKNNMLLDYATYTNGTFSFTTNNVVLGNNIFKLVFYSPYGEKREEEHTYFINNNTVDNNQLGFKTSVSKSQSKTLQSNNPHGKINVNYQLYYGLFNNFNINTFYSLQDNPTSAYLPQNNIVGIGNNISLLGMAVNSSYYYNTNNKNFGVSSDIFSSTKLGTIYSAIDYFNNSQTQQSYSSGVFNRYSFNIRYNANIPFGEQRLPLFVNYQSKQFKNNYQYNNYRNEYNIRLSKSFSGYVFLSAQANLQETINNKKSTITKTANLNANYYINNSFSYQNKTTWLIYNKGTSLTNLENILTYNKNKHIVNTKLIFTKELFNTYLTTAGLSYAIKQNYGTFGLTSEANKNSFSLSFLYSAAFIYNNNNNATYISSEILQNKQAKLMTLIYIDNNLDNKYTQGIDEVISNANIAINNTKYNPKSNNQGYLLVDSVKPYTISNLSVVESSLNDVTLITNNNTETIVAIPNITNFTSIAVFRSGSIYGKLFNNKATLNHNKLLLYNSKNTLVASSFTDKNGYFYLENIPYDEYTIVVLNELLNTKKTSSVFILNKPEINENFYVK